VSVQPVHNERALEIRAGAAKYLVVADIHIGIEAEYGSKGFRIPDQTGRTLERIITLLDRRKPDELVLLGDIRHRIPFAREAERRSVYWFLAALTDRVKVTVVSGNHDSGLSGMAPDGVRIRGSLRIGETGLVHGHSWPPKSLMKLRFLVVDHTHPCVLLVDERGSRIFEPCWLRARFRRCASEYYRPPHPRLIVMPAFVELSSGSPVNGRDARLLGPLFRNGLVDLPGADVHLTDGTFLGNVRHLGVER
jgi:putative SbcD/Mre11-related phosphoesterase